MRIVRAPKKCVARLSPGEVKRIPVADTRYLVGYYMACPSCGRVQAITREEGEMVETGMDVGEIPTLTMKPVECVRCKKQISIVRDEMSAA